MPNDFGFGRGGWGFGFRGASPPWPFVGIGRGGLPRCGYFLRQAAGIPMPIRFPYPFYGWGMPYTSQMTKEQELNFLKSQADTLRVQLEQIENRIRELEKER